MVVGQTAAILQYIAPPLKLVVRNERQRSWTRQIQLTIAELVDEVHASHHPIASELFYEESSR